MNKILIIKLGALGDVLRTTPLLRILKGEITWVTKKNAIPFFKNNSYVHHLVDIRHSSFLKKNRYDLVVSLDEEPEACHLSSNVTKSELIGTYENNGRIEYTDSSAEWFDMSLISRLGKKKADQKKWVNRKSYQEILFAMLGKKFKGEEYILDPQYLKTNSTRSDEKPIGLEMRSGERWVGKRWIHFPKLVNLLKKNCTPFIQFREFPHLSQFIREINKTGLVVTTDSLALHIALALKKKVAAIFTVTSPHEIYGYNRTVKVVNPQLKKYYYSTQPSLKPGTFIQLETVFKALSKLKSNYY